MKLYRENPWPDAPLPNEGLIPRKCSADMYIGKDLRVIGRPMNHKPKKKRGEVPPVQELLDSFQLFLFVCSHSLPVFSCFMANFNH